MTRNKITGAVLATAAAALFGMTGMVTAADTMTASAQVKCSGINACKGMSECASAANACKGQNSCKGHGWMHASKADCDAKGGKVMEDKK